MLRSAFFFFLFVRTSTTTVSLSRSRKAIPTYSCIAYIPPLQKRVSSENARLSLSLATQPWPYSSITEDNFVGWLSLSLSFLLSEVLWFSPIQRFIQLHPMIRLALSKWIYRYTLLCTVTKPNEIVLDGFKLLFQALQRRHFGNMFSWIQPKWRGLV